MLVLSGLIWVQTVGKGYEQTTLVDNELKSGKGRNTLSHLGLANCVENNTELCREKTCYYSYEYVKLL